MDGEPGQKITANDETKQLQMLHIWAYKRIQYESKESKYRCLVPPSTF